MNDLRDERNERDRAIEGEARIPLAEERLDVEKREGQIGEVELRKTVEQEQVSVPVDLEREEVEVRQVDTDDRPVRAGEDVFEEGTLRVPVRGEEAVARKEAVVTGEVVVDKERTSEREAVGGTVRRERVAVDEDYDQYRGGFRQHFDERQRQYGSQWGTRSWEDAEPNYQYGYLAGRDERYGGREFDDAEPELRGDYRRRYGDRDDWEQLREEVREGWNRVRGR